MIIILEASPPAPLQKRGEFEKAVVIINFYLFFLIIPGSSSRILSR